VWNADIVTNTFLNFEYNYQVEFQNIVLYSYLSKITQNLLKIYSKNTQIRVAIIIIRACRIVRQTWSTTPEFGYSRGTLRAPPSFRS